MRFEQGLTVGGLSSLTRGTLLSHQRCSTEAVYPADAGNTSSTAAARSVRFILADAGEHLRLYIAAVDFRFISLTRGTLVSVKLVRFDGLSR